MGASPSLILDPAFSQIKSWQWTRVQNVQKDYLARDLDFGLDEQGIVSFTGLSLEEASQIAKLLSRNESNM